MYCRTRFWEAGSSRSMRSRSTGSSCTFFSIRSPRRLARVRSASRVSLSPQVRSASVRSSSQSSSCRSVETRSVSSSSPASRSSASMTPVRYFVPCWPEAVPSTKKKKFGAWADLAADEDRPSAHQRGRDDLLRERVPVPDGGAVVEIGGLPGVLTGGDADVGVEVGLVTVTPLTRISIEPRTVRLNRRASACRSVSGSRRSLVFEVGEREAGAAGPRCVGGGCGADAPGYLDGVRRARPAA